MEIRRIVVLGSNSFWGIDFGALIYKISVLVYP